MDQASSRKGIISRSKQRNKQTNKKNSPKNKQETTTKPNRMEKHQALRKNQEGERVKPQQKGP